MLFFQKILRTYLAIKYQCCPHIETSQLICPPNQLTGFYIRATLALNGLMNDPLLNFIFPETVVTFLKNYANRCSI